MLAPILEDGNGLKLSLNATQKQSFAWIARPDGFIVWSSQVQLAPDISGGGGIEGYRWRKLLDPATFSDILARWRQLTSSTEPFEFVLPLIDLDGHPRILVAYVWPLVFADGRVTHWIGSSNGAAVRRIDQALRPTRDAQNKAFFDQSVAGFAETDSEGRFTEVNKRYCEITGRTREELLTLRMHDITFVEDLPHNIFLFREAAANGQYFSLKKRYVRPDGRLVWVRNSISAIRDEAGKVQGMVCICVDITQKVTAEEALRQERGRARSVLRNMNEAFLLIGHDYRIIDINTHALRLNQRLKQELVGTLIWDQWPGSEHLDFGRLYKRVMQERKPGTVEQIYHWPDGRHAWLEVRAYPAAEGLAIFFRDVTDRKQAERNNAQLASIVSSSQDAIISCTPDGIIETWNPAAQLLFGWQSNEAIGQSVNLLVSDGHAHEIEGALADACHGKTVRVESVGRRQDNSDIPISLALAPLCDAQGRVVGTTAMIRDISERKRAEKFQKLLLAELGHRMKNSFSVIQAIAHQTFQAEGGTATAYKAFSKRLRSLSISHDLLLQEKWEAAPLRKVLERILDGLGDFGHASQMDGPQIMLPGRTVISFTLVIHELATNAMKYGSLSVHGGTVNICWEKQGEALALHWRERGGPRISKPATSGFGTRLIKQALSPVTGASANIDYQEDGLVCRIFLPLSEA
ncbi:MAG TPA: PAS domain S-box protein [Pedomonas sp.]|uniref:PAS domain-containing sensor histidine kinase n=1 Tax=Pedomonas sp. TaxID=2976421 RepID=UPI002F425BEF